MAIKIVYLLEFSIDLPGGAQMSTQTLCEGICGAEYEPVVVCPKLLTKQTSDYPFRVVEYAMNQNREGNPVYRITNLLRRIAAFHRIIKQEQPDLIHVMLSESLITYGFLRCLGFFKKIPFTYTDRGLFYGYRKHSITCMKAALKHADRMICTTNFNKELWGTNTEIQKIEVISNTVSSAFDDYDENRRKQCRVKEGLQDEDFVIGFAGRISEEKDWPFVKELVAAYWKKGIRFKVAMVISVYEEKDIAIVEDLKQSITAVIGEENLIYKQDLSQQEIADFYYLVDVFVMSSMFESFGKTAVEAMSRKCAVVSTSVGGLTEGVHKEENLYIKEAYEKGVERINKLYHDAVELNKDKIYFYQRYLNYYTRQVYLERHKQVYRDILNII